MSEPSQSPLATDNSAPATRCLLLSAVLVFGAFLLTSALRAPVPAVNEPHYLGKAKHFWDSTWCAGDFFLESSNAHLVFYSTVGWMTQWLTLPQTAWVARCAALLLLAWGWTRLCSRLFDSTWGAVVAATLFLLMTAYGSFSGEWVIGGVEGKVFTYGAMLWSAACLLEGRWNAAAVLAGIGVSFHPVVGVWCVAAAVGGVVLRTLFRQFVRNNDERAGESPEKSPLGVAEAMLALVLFVVACLPGVLPALQIVVGVDPDIARQADQIQLTQRLGHHIDPRLFPWSAFRLYAVLLVTWLLLWAWGPRGRVWTRMNFFVLAAVLIAVGGFAIGWAPNWLSPLGDNAVTFGNKLRQGLLKFYLFRLADVAIPAAIALLISHLLERGTRQVPVGRFVLPVLFLGGALSLPAPDANASGMMPEDRDSWIALCRWIDAETPPHTLLATANEDWAIKWHANRPEYVSFKDCPQDAAGILEWWRRRQTLVGWSRESKADGEISEDDMRTLHERTGIDYLIVSRYSGFAMPPVREEGSFKLYRVGPMAGGEEVGREEP